MVPSESCGGGRTGIRGTAFVGLALAVVLLGSNPSNASASTVRTKNTRLMATQMRMATTPQLIFFGSAYRFGSAGGGGAGKLEGASHGALHVFTSDPNARMDGMGVVDRAAFDRLFYLHHANLDRLWEVWKTAGGRGNRVDIADEDYLNLQFVFFDENQRLVYTEVSQVLDVDNLRYNYQQVVNSHMTASSQMSMSSMSMDSASGAMPPSTTVASINSRTEEAN